MSKHTVSIRAPTRGAMATHSQIHPIRAPTTPLSQQNRRILGNPFPRTHPCTRPLKEETSRFYNHLRFALRRSISSSHRHLCHGCNFRPYRQTTFFGLPRHPTKRRVRPCYTINHLTKPFLWLIKNNSITNSLSHFRNYFL